MNQQQINQNVPKLAKPVARLGIAAYPKEKAGEIFIDEMPTANEAITGDFHGTRTLKPDDIREYALKLLEMADHVDQLNGIEVEPNPIVELAKWDKIRNRIWRLSEEPIIHHSEIVELETALESCTVLGIFQQGAENIELSLERASVELERIRDTAVIIHDKPAINDSL